MKNSTFFVFMLLILAWALFTFFHKPRITGAIDQQFIEILSAVKSGDTISVSSTGGDPDFAEQAAQIIIDKNLSVVIKGICFSSCAEYLLPAATKVRFSGRPLIGFHQNPLMIKHFLKSNPEYENSKLCHFEDNLEFIENLHERELGRTDFWHDVLLMTEKERAGFKQLDDCVEVRFGFKHKMWLPSSEQLKSQYRLAFKGKVCADEHKCLRRNIDRIWDKGTRIVGREYDYISNGN